MKNLDWGKLSFGYSKTDYNVRCYYKDGKWSAPEVSDSEMLNIHMASTCLHYGVKMEKSVSSVVKKMQNVCLVLPNT